MWVRDAGSWKVVKELYTRDGGSWKKVHPMFVFSCFVSVVSNGVCDGSDGTWRISSAWRGPQPQFVSAPDTNYNVSFYARASSTSLAHLLGLSFTFRGSNAGMTSGTQNQNVSMGFVVTSGTANRWFQGQVRMNHSVDGQLTGDQHVKQSSVISRRADECGPE
jgi:hypothetical protein